MFHSSHQNFRQCKFSCHTLFDQSLSGIDLELLHLHVTGYLNKHFCKIGCRTFNIFRAVSMVDVQWMTGFEFSLGPV